MDIHSPIVQYRSIPVQLVEILTQSGAVQTFQIEEERGDTFVVTDKEIVIYLAKHHQVVTLNRVQLCGHIVTQTVRKEPITLHLPDGPDEKHN